MVHRIAFIADPWQQWNLGKDSTLFLVETALARGHSVFLGTREHLAWQQGSVLGKWSRVHTANPSEGILCDNQVTDIPLTDFDTVCMRCDPPFDSEYYYATLLLAYAKQQGVRIINDPDAVRAHNEKCAILRYHNWIPPTLVTRQMDTIQRVLRDWGKCVIKPLDSMGGSGIFILDAADPNTQVICETVTCMQTRTVMLQAYVPLVRQGDNRIWVIHGEPIPWVLSRIPQGTDHRANMVRGGKPIVRALTDTERTLAQSVGADLAQKGLYWVGLDVIGDYLTEINVTSPTGLREIQRAQPDFPLAEILWKPLEHPPQ